MFDLRDEQSVMKHLKEFEQIQDLAMQIVENGYDTLGERLIVLKKIKDGKELYTVLEGNRRVAALKLLFKYQDLFSSSERKKIEMQNLNIEQFKVNCDVIYENERDAASFKIIAKHIDGFKTWSPTDKRVYYFNLYKRHLENGLTSKKAIDEIFSITPEKKNEIRKAIRELKFLESIRGAVLKKYPKIEPLSRLKNDVLISRFLNCLKTDLSLDESDTFDFIPTNKEKYEQILCLIGVASWIDKTVDTRNFNKINQWESLLNEDEKVPGLKLAIKSYRESVVENINVPERTPEPLTKNGEGNLQINSEHALVGEKVYKMMVKDTVYSSNSTNRASRNLMNNVCIYDSRGNEVSRGSSEYKKIKFTSDSNALRLKDGVVEKPSKTGSYTIVVVYNDQSDEFLLRFTTEDKPTPESGMLMFDEEWYHENFYKIKKKPSYGGIVSILSELKKHSNLSEQDERYIVPAFLLRTLIEYVSKAYLDKKSSNSQGNTEDKLPQIIAKVTDSIKNKKLITSTDSKTLKKSKDLEVLNGNIHSYKTGNSKEDILSIFNKYRIYIDTVIEEITE